jgi:hypothetical protein
LSIRQWRQGQPSPTSPLEWMNAKLKCSNCGAEITNLTFSWGIKQWLWMLLPILLAIVCVFWLAHSRGDFRKELSISVLNTRFSTNEVAVLGVVTNSGKHEWQSVMIKAEFYDKEGRFLDEASEYLSGSVRPRSEEHFRISLRKPAEEITTGSPKVVVKVSEARDDIF